MTWLSIATYEVCVPGAGGNVLEELEQEDEHDMAVLHDVEGEHGVTSV